MKCGIVLQPTNFSDWERVFARDWTRSQVVTDAELWARITVLVEDAEELGFDKVWTTEHHESPYGLIPNPLTFLAMVAGRTKRIGVGTMVIVVPWWHTPVRIAEEIALVDCFLQGRDFTVGFGRGVAAREFNLLGIDRGESRGRFAEGIEVVKKALLNEEFSHDGEFWHMQNARIRPRPTDGERLVANMVGAFSGAESADAVARAGLGMITITGKGPALVGEDVARFNGVRCEIGLSPMQPIVQACVICTETEADAEGAFGWFDDFETQLEWHYRFSDAEGFAGVTGYEAYFEKAKAKTPWANRDDLFVCGTPEVVLARLKQVQKLTSAKEFVISPTAGGVPLEVARKTMRLLSEHVLPELHAIDAPLHDHASAWSMGSGRP
jgi:alkanesulfonate monooxygenase SsuD/methylene tetrahydromethanopterin reductase-like flavin-dependent oxidoreductase (luciferase family)